MTIRNADLLRTVTLEDVADATNDYTHDIRIESAGVNSVNEEVVQRIKADLEDLIVGWKGVLKEHGLDHYQFEGEVGDILSLFDGLEKYDEIPFFDLDNLID